MAARPLKRPRRSSGLPYLPTDIDNAVAALGGRTHAIDLADNTIQSQQAPVSKEKRLEELVRDSGRLRQELGYWKSVALTGTTFMSNVDEAVTQLREIVSRFASVMDETNAMAVEESMGPGHLIGDNASRSSAQRLQLTQVLCPPRSGPPPTATLITDVALTEESPDAWDAIIAYVRQGGTPIVMGHVSSSVKPNNLRPFFAKAGLNWESAGYHRTTVALNPQTAGSAAERLPTRYSQEALFLKGVHPTAVLYGPNKTSATESLVFPTEKVTDLTHAAISFAQVGNGKTGYAGDVNVEEGTNDAILAMCGFLV
ncbi:triacylglycerol lipase [Colletotrichum incanum]|uniref:Triacylglycerol lipase n=1 Tax=Colletotrichum incanum TaxID=1573173 RepID=A0A167CQH5_COLIC|nr:triacylglycerol lipase [Colletotrichum incanum]